MNRLNLRLTALLAVVVLLGLGWAARPAAAADTVQAMYSTDQNMSVAEVNDLRLAVNNVYDFDAANAIPSPGAVQVFAYADINQLAQMQYQVHLTDGTIDASVGVDKFALDWQHGQIGCSSPGYVWIDRASTLWQQDRAFRFKLLSHEMFHMVQHQLSHTDNASRVTAQAKANWITWITEGSAEYMGYQAGIYAGVYNANQVRAQWHAGAKAATVRLNMTATTAGQANAGANFWGLSVTAVDYLVTHNGGQQALLNYFSAMGQGMGWRQAFQSAFGVTPFDFYKQFEAYRASL